MELLSIPAAWRGSELFDRVPWPIELQSSDVEELLSVLRSVREYDGETTLLNREQFVLPRLGPRLASIQHELEAGAGACLVRGFPIDQLAETDARRLFWGITTHLGTAVSQSAASERIFSVRDEGFKVSDPKARGPNTRRRLRFHTDRCDVIAFLCLRQARSGGENQLVSSVAVFNEMLQRRPDLVELLMRPYYYQRHNVDTGNEDPWCQQPIFSFCEGKFACSYLRVLIDRAYAMPALPELSDLQREALDYLEELASDPTLHVTFRLESGDLLFLNNWVTLHRRNEFQDAPDPALRRHLLRIWLSVPNSRPIHPDFAANFGATEAGAVRGGMRSER